MQINVPAPFSANDLAAFLQAQGAEGEGLSTEELMKLTGRSRGWVRTRLKELDEAGRLDVTQKQAQRIDHRPGLVPAYSLLPPEERGN